MYRSGTSATPYLVNIWKRCRYILHIHCKGEKKKSSKKLLLLECQESREDWGLLRLETAGAHELDFRREQHIHNSTPTQTLALCGQGIFVSAFWSSTLSWIESSRALWPWLRRMIEWTNEWKDGWMDEWIRRDGWKQDGMNIGDDGGVDWQNVYHTQCQSKYGHESIM